MNSLEAFPGKKNEQKHPVAERVSDAIDLVPIVGGVKMMIESGVGKTLDGRDLSGKRMEHLLVGGASIALDVTGVGAPEGEALVAAEKGATLFEKAGAHLQEQAAAAVTKEVKEYSKNQREKSAESQSGS